MNVNKIIDSIINAEGGFVNDPVDRGGVTNYGITQLTATKWLGFEPTTEQMQCLSIDVARAIYLNEYYLKPKINELPDFLQPIVLDMAINHGPNRAYKLLQTTIESTGYNIVIDGLFGPKSFALLHDSLSQYTKKQFIQMLVNVRKHFFAQIVENDAAQAKFYKGWIKRAESFLL